MLIKSAADRATDLATLQSLRAHPKATADTRTRIDQEIRNIRAGAKGEAEAAYEIDFHHKLSRNWAVIHDLRVEYQGRVAQIDHLLINRFLDFWVCESKHFSEGISINEHGEFTAFYGKRPYGVPSPLEQNRKHVAVLQALTGSSIVQLPTRLGLAIRPTIHSVVLVSKGARITRPKTKLEGIDSIIKNDQLRQLIEKRIDEQSAALTLMSATKIIGADTLEDFARQVARLHRPVTFDWAGKFGLKSGDEPNPDSKVRLDVAAATVVDRAMPQQAARPVEARPASKADSRPASAGANPPEGRLSTSRLAAKRGVKTAEMLERLVAAGYLVAQGDQHVLTDKANAVGATLVEQGRYSPYFLWPEDLQV
jgi:hypothetical protein